VRGEHALAVRHVDGEGLSVRTWSPARSASIATVGWLQCGVAITTASTRPDAIIAR
jgi:hypothetical protein